MLRFMSLADVELTRAVARCLVVRAIGGAARLAEPEHWHETVLYPDGVSVMAHQSSHVGLASFEGMSLVKTVFHAGSGAVWALT